MRDEMKIGDPVLFYHSSTEPIGVAGLAEVASVARPDMSAFDPTDQFFDPKSKPENPSWVVVDIKFVAKLPKLVPLADLKSRAELAQMMVCQRGNRPSVQPVDPKHFSLIKKLGGL
jgi:predicted RNA-binding protein with PUA-like domain